LKQQEGVEIEIVVVDNLSPREGEQDKIRALCEEQHCTFIQATENRGYNAGNNIGLRYAAEKGYKYALIANPDMEFPQKDYLKKMVEAMEKDQDIVVCGTDIVTIEGIHQNPMKRDGDWQDSFKCIKVLFVREKPTDCYGFMDDYSHTHYCAKVSGCCLMLRLDYIQKIGFFDENVFLYCEEAILSRKVEHDGMKMYYLADAQAVHRHIPSEKGDSVKRFQAWSASRRYFEVNYNDEGWMKNGIKRMNHAIYDWAFSCHNMIKKYV
jgi:hypothetical protein